MPIRKTVTLTLVSALLLAVASAIVGYSESLVHNALFGAIVGALSGLLICAIVCRVGNELASQIGAGHPRTGTIGNVIVGACVGLIITSVLVTVSLTAVGLINHRPDPFLWGAMISSLGAWVLGGLLGALIGAAWSRGQL